MPWWRSGTWRSWPPSWRSRAEPDGRHPGVCATDVRDAPPVGWSGGWSGWRVRLPGRRHGLGRQAAAGVGPAAAAVGGLVHRPALTLLAPVVGGTQRGQLADVGLAG